MDGNFELEHMNMKNPENDVYLSDGEAFMVQKTHFDYHLQLATDTKEVHLIFVSICMTNTGLIGFNMLQPQGCESGKQREQKTGFHWSGCLCLWTARIFHSS
jgi:hypothetical protein